MRNLEMCEDVLDDITQHEGCERIASGPSGSHRYDLSPFRIGTDGAPAPVTCDRQCHHVPRHAKTVCACTTHDTGVIV